MAISYQRKLGDGTIVIDSGTSSVGIGTNDPSEKLEVVGNAKIGATGTASRYYIIRPSDGNTAAYYGYHSADNGDFGIHNGSGGGNIIFTSNDGALQFKNTSNSTTVFNVSSSGFITSSGLGSSNEIALYATGTADATNTEYDSNVLRFSTSGWDTNNSVARAVHWNVRSEASSNIYPDAYLTFYEENISYNHWKLKLPGRGSGDSYIHPDAALFNGNVVIYESDTTNQNIKLLPGGVSYFANSVGIGTTSAYFPLHVEGGILAGTSASTTAINQGVWVYGNVDGNYRYGMDLGHANSRWRTRIVAPSDSTNGTDRDISFAFSPNTGATAQSDFTEAMVIRGDTYNVGIGTASPERKLHVFKAESGGAASNVNSTIVLENNTHTYVQFLTPATAESGLLFGDTDNDAGAFVYKHSTNSLHFRTNAVSDRMIIDSSGNVGIGTTNPTEKLTVAGQLYFPNISTTDGTNVISFSESTDKSFSFKAYYNGVGASGNKFGIGSDLSGWSSNIMTWRGDGRVGIGTTSPETKLHLYEASATPTLLTLHNYQADIAPGHGNFIDFKMTDDNATAVPQVRIGMVVGTEGGADDGIATEGDGNFVIQTTNATGATGTETPTEKLRVTHAGNVGIGTTDPSQKLHVVGNAIFQHPTGTQTSYFLDNDGDGLRITAWNNGANIDPAVANDDLYFGRDVTMANFIVQSGNVGIGTTSPGAKLDVEGRIIDDTNSRVVSNARIKNIDNDNYFNLNDNSTVDDFHDFWGVKTGGSGTITKVDDSTAPAPGCFEISGRYDVDSGGDYIKVNTNEDYTFEMYIKYVSGADTDQRLYLGWSMYDAAKNYFGNTRRYWAAEALQVDANSYQSGDWVKVVGTISGVGTSLGQFISGTQYVKLLALFNYSSEANVIRVCGFKLYKSSKYTTELKVVPRGAKYADTSHFTDYFPTIKHSDGSGYTGIRLHTSQTNSNWGDVFIGANNDWGSTYHPTIGSNGGSSGSLVMIQNPHVPYRTDNAATGYSARAGLRMARDTSGNWWDAGLAGDFYHIYRNGTGEFLRITNVGNVGIGITSPGAKLDVVGKAKIGNGISTSDYEYPFTVANDNNRTDAYSGTVLFRDNRAYDSTNNGGGIIFGGLYSSANDIAWWASIKTEKENATDGNYAAAMKFLTRANGASPAEHMRITSAGNVGIGTTSPSRKLDVSGTGRVTGQFLQGSGTARSTNGTTIAFTYNTAYSANSDLGDGGRFLSIVNESTVTNAYSALSFRVNPNSSGGGTNAMLDMKFVNANNGSSNLIWSFTSGGGWADRMALTSDGNLGIGTTSPQSNLHIVTSSQTSVPSAGAGAVKGLFVSNDLTTYGMMLGSISNGNGYIQQQRTDSVTYYNLLLQPNGGNVGIGTTSPSEKLSVAGNIALVSNNSSISFNTSASSGDPKIQMGSDGDFSFLNTAGSTTLHIENGGNVGIGTTVPQQLLHIKGATSAYIMLEADSDSGITGTYYKSEDTDNTMNRTKGFFGWQGQTAYGNGYFTMWLDTAEDNGTVTSSEEKFRWERDGDFHADGDVIAYSTTTPSDARLKKDVTTIENASKKVAKLRGVEYTWSVGKNEGKREIGLIAQEVEAVVPEVVTDRQLPLLTGTTEEYKTVDYERLIALLIESNKELQNRITELESKVYGANK
jgi:hypothetical protein